MARIRKHRPYGACCHGNSTHYYPGKYERYFGTFFPGIHQKSLSFKLKVSFYHPHT